MNALITGLVMFASGLGAVVLILIWHNYRVTKITKLLEEQHENNPEVVDNQIAVRSDVDGNCGSTTRGK
jgi:hypothetical protein